MKFLPILLLTAAAAFGADKKNVLMIAGKPSHGPGQHEHNAGVQLLTKALQQGVGDQVDVKFTLNGTWPAPEDLAKADTIVIYADGGGGHPALVGDHLAQLGKEMKRGCGFVCLHYAVEPDYARTNWPDGAPGPDGKPTKTPPPPGRGSNGKGSPEFLDWLGGYFEAWWSVNPHWTADFSTLPKHAISNGVKPFSTNDEWYFRMRFRPEMKGVTPILSAIPPVETTKRGDGAHEGNPELRKEVELKLPQTVSWAVEREDGGRGFGFTGGHYHAGWKNGDQRKLVLNAILWTAKGTVPPNGVEDKLVEEDFTVNLDPKNKK